jgi:hypothetical protein
MNYIYSPPVYHDGPEIIKYSDIEEFYVTGSIF